MEGVLTPLLEPSETILGKVGAFDLVEYSDHRVPIPSIKFDQFFALVTQILYRLVLN